MVGLDNSSQQADSLPKSVGLVCIHQMNGMQWLCHYDNTTIVVVTAIIAGTDNISLRQAVCVL